MRTTPALLCGLLVTALLAGCAGVDMTAVQRADPAAAAPADASLARGRIRHVVDGQPLAYGLLNRPAFELFHRDTGRRMPSPVVEDDGRFTWRLPPGDYGVAMIVGGMSPTGVPRTLPSGALVFVNGLVDPGFEFKLERGAAHDLGTLVVEVESRPAEGLLNFGERVFKRLVGVRVEADAAPAAGWRASPWQRAERAPRSN